MICNDCVYEYPSMERVVVIGDIHGDIKRLKTILVDAQIINLDLQWIAEPQNTIVVQMGDQVDSINRNNNVEWEKVDDISVIHFTHSIDKIARTKGGRFISLIGNHELMNSIGNFTYVSEQSKSTNRRSYFMPKGSLCSILQNRNIVLKIGGLFFCHAGINKHHIEILDKYNKNIEYLNEMWKNYISNGLIKNEDAEMFDKILNDDKGILWTRTFESEDDIQYVLQRLNSSYIFIGHTTVPKISLYEQKIWLTDTGISRAYGSNQYQYMDIVKNNINVKTITE
jgi:hypothetical protein